MLKIGNTNINKAYLGGSEINRAYLGSQLIIGNHVFQTETQDIIDRSNLEGFTLPNNTTLMGIDLLIKQMKLNGTYWSDRDVIANFSYNDLSCDNFSLINWKNPNGNLLTVNGGMTYTLNGWKSNGIDGYINSTYNPSLSVNTTIDSIGITHGLENDFPYDGGAYFGCRDTNPTRILFISPSYTSTSEFYASNDNSSSFKNVHVNAKRIYSYGRKVDEQYIISNGTRDFSVKSSVSPLINRDYYIHAYNRGDIVGYSNGTSFFFDAGKEITETQSQQLISDMNVFLTKIGLETI